MPFLAKLGAAAKDFFIGSAKKKALEIAAENLTDEEKLSQGLKAAGCGLIGCLLFPIFIFIVLFSFILGTVQISEAQDISNLTDSIK